MCADMSDFGEDACDTDVSSPSTAGRAQRDTDLRRAQMILLEILKAIDAVCETHGIAYYLDAGTLLGAIRHRGFVPWDDDVDIVMSRPDFERFLHVANHQLPVNMCLQTIELDPDYRRFRTPCKVRHLGSCAHELGETPSNSRLRGLYVDVFAYDRFHKSGWRRSAELVAKRVYSLTVKYFYAVPHPGPGPARLMKNLLARAKPTRTLHVALLVMRRMMLVRFAMPNQRLPDDSYDWGAGFDCVWTRLFDPQKIFPFGTAQFEGHHFPVPRNPDYVLRKFYGDYRELPPPSERRPTHIHSVVLIDRAAGSSATSPEQSAEDAAPSA